MNQRTRNAIYLGVSGVLTVALAAGVITEAEQGTILEWTDKSIDLITQLVALATTVLAFIKSKTSKVTTVERPVGSFVAVDSQSGDVVQ